MSSGRLLTDPACPCCGKTLNGWTGADHDHQPSPGDVTVCVYCAEVLVFTDQLDLRRPTPEEKQDPEIQRVYRDVASAVKGRLQ